MAVIGWDGPNESVIFQNWWGEEWGDDGCGYMSREYFDRYVTDAWLSRDVRTGLNVEKAKRLRGSTNAYEFTRTWMLENPRWRRKFKHAGRRLKWVVYETLSVTGHPVQIIELRTGYGLRLGWAYVFHYCGDDRNVSIVKELFVWPAFREQGLGTLIEGAVTNVARKCHTQQIQILFHAADHVHGEQSPGRRFGETKGYTWKWSMHERPCLVAIGEKTL